MAEEVSTARQIYLDLQVMDGWVVQVQKRGKRNGEVKNVEKGTALCTHACRMPGYLLLRSLVKSCEILGQLATLDPLEV